jgi:hypothetical protein
VIKFNNAHPDHRGCIIWINPEHIYAVYEEASQPGGSLATKIYGGSAGIVWTVEESLSEVVKKLEKKEI